MSHAFSLSHVSKAFRGRIALDNVTLSSDSGVVVALLGENGAGKTTALKILLGLIEADQGEATVLGLNSATHGLEIRNRVGYVPDQPALYDWMTVAETGWFVAGFYPNGYEQSYRELVRHFELPLDRKIKELSKGMRAKVSLSLALAHNPDLLILDEPTSGLDPLVRREFLESMVDVAAQGRTVLLASHQIAEVERVADAVAILREGELVLVDKLEEIKSHLRQIVVTLRNGSADMPPIPATVLHREIKGRQCRLLVRNIDDSRFDAFRADKEVGEIELRHPSLEEIYVSYMQADRT